MLQKVSLATLSILPLAAFSSAEGLYSKNSGVLQVDGLSYNKIVAKSNQVSVSLNLVADPTRELTRFIDRRVSYIYPK